METTFIDYEAERAGSRRSRSTGPRPPTPRRCRVLDDLDEAWRRAAEDDDGAGHRPAGQRQALLRRATTSSRRGRRRRAAELDAGRHLRDRGPALPRVLPALAQRAQAVDRRRAGRVHRRRPAAGLALRPDHRGRQRQVLRPGREPGHRRRRVPRPHLGVGRPQGQGAAVHRPGDDRGGGRAPGHGHQGRARSTTCAPRPGRWPRRSPRSTPSPCARPSGRSTRPSTCRASTPPSSRCSTSTRPATATRSASRACRSCCRSTA